MLTGALAVALFLRLGPTLAFAGYFAFAAALVVITFIDLDHQIIPDVISLPGIVVGLAFSLVSPLVTPLDAAARRARRRRHAARRRLALQDLPRPGGHGRRRRQAAGDDRRLPRLAEHLRDALRRLGDRLDHRRRRSCSTSGADTKLAIPFGPFLAGGALVYLFFGDRILAFYFGA